MLNEDIVIPELKAAGKELKTKFYPGTWHGFSRGSKEFFDDAFAFYGKSIKTAPRPISQPETTSQPEAKQKQKQKQAKAAPTSNEAKPAPDLANIAYGPHERNVFDLWKAKSDKPTPLVVYIHGGGFQTNSKQSVSPQLLKACLDNGLSVAAINYRLSPQYHFPDHFMDSARAIQFLRSKAKEYNLDPKRVAATGASAGAGTSLWIAFHDDMADPNNPDPVLRESTRLTCVAVVDAQTTYDPRAIQKMIGGRGDLWEPLRHFYGLKPGEENSERAHKLYEAASPINYATADDPPVWMHYREAKGRLPDDAQPGKGGHHPNFGYSLKDNLDKLGVGCIVRHASEYPGERTPIRSAERGTSGEMVDFFKRNFGTK
jgi:acetyl esterase